MGIFLDRASQPVDLEKVSAMRVLLKVSMDTEKANEAISNGTLPKLIESSLEQIKPEAAYFTSENGQRTAFLFFDMEDSSQMPVISEPFFMNLGAKISYTPVMNREDLQKGLSQLGR
jgi:CRISPR/Cas system endoribonuclease Cas6 (RAMP superfamily)